jgi:hypothetical protein
MASDLAAIGLRAIGTENIYLYIKGGMGAGKPIFQKWPWLYGIAVNPNQEKGRKRL